jgi:chromosomal replication initiation ATPase DnaA
MVPAKYLPPRFMVLVRNTADAFSISPEDVLVHSRSKSRTNARHIVMWAMRKIWTPQPSFPEIGKMFDRDHTTIMAAVKRIDHEITCGSSLGQLALKLTTPVPVMRLVPSTRVIDQLEFEFERKQA